MDDLKLDWENMTEMERAFNMNLLANASYMAWIASSVQKSRDVGYWTRLQEWAKGDAEMIFGGDQFDQVLLKVLIRESNQDDSGLFQRFDHVYRRAIEVRDAKALGLWNPCSRSTQLLTILSLL